MPLYHEALRSQAEMEREASGRAQADRLGLPVIAVQRSEGGEGTESLGSEMFEEKRSGDEKEGGEGDREGDEESDSSGERDTERERKAGLGVAGGNGADNGRAGVLHSTRASSGVFPETERDIPERSEKDVYS